MTLFAGHARIKRGHEARHAWRAALALALTAGLSMAAPASADDPPEWSTPVKPFNIAGNIFYVGTQGLAAYLIVSNQGAILLDGTTAKNAPLIERNIQQVGVPLHAVKRLISDHAYPEIVSDYRATFRKLETLNADIVLPSHPDLADVLEREARREAGEKDAFIDPQVLAALVAHYSAAFEADLAAGR